jgi:hypothetical protein
MTVPHRNDTAGFAPLRPDYYHQPLVEMARGDKSYLAIVAPLIRDRCCAASKHLARSREIQSAKLERQITLRRIEGDLHLIVPPINVKQGASFSAPSSERPRASRTQSIELDPGRLGDGRVF